MTDRPRIGITKCTKMPDYEESVRRAGGEPVLLDWDAMTPQDALARVDAIVLTGGPDVSPEHYGQTPHPSVQTAGAARDAFELELTAAAVQRDVPVLAICRGMQVLNVALGGSLVQDIPTERPGTAPHAVNEPKNAIAHPVTIAPGSRLAAMLGRTEAPVNSRHHQAVATIGDGMTITATAPDGIVEAIEKPDARFVVGVEWHPENFVESGEFLPLFRGLVEATRKC